MRDANPHQQAGTRRAAHVLVSDMSALIWFPLLLGASASAAALWGYYRVLPGWLTGPEVCQLEAGGCAGLFWTPRAAP